MMTELWSNICWINQSYIVLALLAAWRAMPLLLIAVGAGLFFRRRLLAKYHAVLWSLVVVRLLMPISIGSSWSIHSAIDHAIAKLFEDDSPPRDLIGLNELDLPEPTTVFQVDDRPYYFHNDTPIAYQPNPIPIDNRLHHSGAKVSDWFFLCVAIVLTGISVLASGLILRSVIAHVRFALKLARCKELNEPEIVLLLAQECNSLGISRIPRLKEVADISAPAVFGLLRTTICLPSKFVQAVSAQELRWIVRHELAHVSRCDTWTMTLATLAQAVHCFNPLAWFTVARLRANMEAAADHIAVGAGSSANAVAYGRLLIRIAEGSSGICPSAALGLLPFAAKGTLKKRIEKLATGYSPNRAWIAWTFAAAIVAIIAIAFTDEAEVKATPQVSDMFATTDLQSKTEVAFDEPEPVEETHRKEYDISEVIEKLADETSWDPSAEGLGKMLQMIFPKRDIHIEGNTLLADLTNLQHERISDMLRAWADQGPQQIAIEYRMIKANLMVTSKVDWISHQIENIEHQGSLPVLAAKISDAEMRSFMRDVQSDPQTNVFQSPKVTLFNGQFVTINDGYKRAFVVGVKPIRGNLAVAMEPVIDVKKIGMNTSFQPRIQHNGTVELKFDIQLTRLVEERLAKLPFRTNEDRQVPMYSYVTVEAPVISSESIKSTLELMPNETILITIPELDKDSTAQSSEKTMVYAITPRVLELK